MNKMLKPELYLESAIANIGKPLQVTELSLGLPNRKVEDFALAHGVFQEGQRKRYIYLEKVGPYERWDLVESTPAEYKGRYTEAVGWELALVQLIEQTVSEASSGMEVRKLEWLQVLIRELVLNALEHGAEFGKKGTVTLRGINGTDGQLWFVHQTTPGVDFADPRAVKVRRKDGLYQDKLVQQSLNFQTYGRIGL